MPWFESKRARQQREEQEALEEQRYNEKKERLKQALDNLGKSFDKEANGPRKPHVLVTPQAVVSYIDHKDYGASPYELLTGLVGFLDDGDSPIERKIKTILAANPRADLKALESSLEVTIINVQFCPAPPASSAKQIDPTPESKKYESLEKHRRVKEDQLKEKGYRLDTFISPQFVLFYLCKNDVSSILIKSQLAQILLVDPTADPFSYESEFDFLITRIDRPVKTPKPDDEEGIPMGRQY